MNAKPPTAAQLAVLAPLFSTPSFRLILSTPRGAGIGRDRARVYVGGGRGDSWPGRCPNVQQVRALLTRGWLEVDPESSTDRDTHTSRAMTISQAGRDLLAGIEDPAASGWPVTLHVWKAGVLRTVLARDTGTRYRLHPDAAALFSYRTFLEHYETDTTVEAALVRAENAARTVAHRALNEAERAHTEVLAIHLARMDAGLPVTEPPGTGDLFELHQVTVDTPG